MRNSQMTSILMVALLAWGLWIAAGSWQHNRGQLKFLIIAGFVMAFLGVWWVLLQMRARRLSRKPPVVP